jgi:hypothetical protein
MAEKKETISVAISTGSIATSGLGGYGTTAGGYGAGSLAYTRTDLLTVAPDGHPIYALVGRVASGWSHVEHTLDEIIWELAGIEPIKGAAMTAQIMGAYSRFKAILALLSRPELANRPGLELVLKRVTELTNKSSGQARNEIGSFMIPGTLTQQVARLPSSNQCTTRIIDTGFKWWIPISSKTP